jgi:hypothetical protein
MVSLHVAVSGADDPALRQTLDADLGVEQQVAGDPALVDGLEDLGYERPESANRFIRTAPGGQRLVIDLLAHSFGSRMRTNRRHGEMTLDEIPGLSLALALPGERVELHVQLLDESTVELISGEIGALPVDVDIAAPARRAEADEAEAVVGLGKVRG